MRENLDIVGYLYSTFSFNVTCSKKKIEAINLEYIVHLGHNSIIEF